MIETLRRLWESALASHPVPGTTVLLATGVVAAVLVWWGPTYRWVRLGVTVVHEAGHALVAVLVGRRLSGIKLHSDTSGVTLSRGRLRGAGMVAMLCAGYLAPASLGVVAALLLAGGRAVGLLWLLMLLCAALVIWVRNVYAFAVVVALGVGLGMVSWYGSGQLHWLLASLVTWALLLAAPRPLLELIGNRATRAGSDPAQLARITPLPALLWIALLLLATLAGLALGAVTLLPQLL